MFKPRFLASLYALIWVLLLMIPATTTPVRAQNTGAPLVVSTCDNTVYDMTDVGLVQRSTVDLNGNLCASISGSISVSADPLSAQNCTATVAVPTRIEGQSYPCSENLKGAIRVTPVGTDGTELGSINNPSSVQGDASSGAADSGTGPVKIGGRYNSTQPTLTNGQRGDVQLSTRGEVKSNIYDAAGNARGANVDASGNLNVVTSATGATGSAPPAAAGYVGANGSGATGGLLAGLKMCDLHAKYDASDNGSITMVTGVAGRKVYICGFILATGGTATNLKLREGSDANCATNAADLTPAYQLVANDRIGANAAFWNGLAVSTNAYYVCVNASAGNAHQAEVFYTIQ